MSLTFADGRSEVMPSHVVLWTAGARPATGEPRHMLHGTHDHLPRLTSVSWQEAGGRAPAQRVGLPFAVDGRGAMKTDPTLRVLDTSRVFALGDVAAVSSEGGSTTFPATAQVAFQQADYVAWNVWASINGRPTLPFRYQHLGDMMSLGRWGSGGCVWAASWSGRTRRTNPSTLQAFRRGGTAGAASPRGGQECGRPVAAGPATGLGRSQDRPGGHPDRAPGPGASPCRLPLPASRARPLTGGL